MLVMWICSEVLCSNNDTFKGWAMSRKWGKEKGKQNQLHFASSLFFGLAYYQGKDIVFRFIIRV
jgi:hypothetical protein